jgi:outer membrane protein OmpA-like peptidoglycan-associated protein
VVEVRGAQTGAWQGDLLQAGASFALTFTAATDDQLPAVVDAGLDGRAAIPFELAQLRYRPSQYTLPPTAIPSLDKVLHLLTVSYPEATATVDGYTDSLAVPGGNVQLSWRRARTVEDWLIRHGVSADRIQAIGYGAADPIVPNEPGGQPLNRRVVIIISPGRLSGPG